MLKDYMIMDEDDTSSIGNNSNVTEDSQLSETSFNRKGRGRGKVKEKVKTGFKLTDAIKENHKQPIFGCQFNWNIKPNHRQVFATVGGNRVSIYECNDGLAKFIQTYEDSDPEEGFYSCAWTHDTDSGLPLLAVAGVKGVVRVISLSAFDSVKNLVGHGQSINEVQVHPKNPDLVLSVSKDNCMRLWNVKTEHCVVIFGGVGGHRDEVLSADFNQEGTLIVSCGMDHSLKVWKMSIPGITNTIRRSYNYNAFKSSKPFPTHCQHYPEFTTRDIHRNYIDCAKWFGRLILSKSCESSIICWKPGVPSSFEAVKPTDNSVTFVNEYEFKDCDIWFVRFALDHQQTLLAQGNQFGRIYLWELYDKTGAKKPVILSTKKCVSAIRQCHFSRDGKFLLSVCDDSTVWLWTLK